METLSVGIQNTARMKPTEVNILIVNPRGKGIAMPKRHKTGLTNHFSVQKFRKTT